MKKAYYKKSYVRTHHKGKPHDFVRTLTPEQEKQYKELWKNIKPYDQR